MNLRSTLLLGLLLAGCSAPPTGPGPGGEIPGETGTSKLRIPIPAGLRESGGVLVASRLHSSRPAQESVIPVAAGTQEFEVERTEGDVIAVSLLSPEGEVTQVGTVQAGATTFPGSPANPRLLRVPQDHRTIQAAVDAARAGDTVLVAPGTYTETVRLKSGIRLLGSGAASTLLDGGGAPVKLVDFSGATDVVVAGFTFQNVGLGNPCDGQDVMKCSGNWYSAAVYADGHTEQGQAPTSALVVHNVFRNNPIGVLLYFHARAVVRNNIFVRNTHGFVANHFQDVGLVANNVFWENTEEAIVNQAAYLDIIGNVVARSGVGILHQYIQNGRIRCNLFFQNGANGADVHLVPPRFEIGKDGNIELDPLFEHPELGDFHPKQGSPLHGAGCFDGPDGTPQVLGAYGGPLGRWR
jgi:hypothetical protein